VIVLTRCWLCLIPTTIGRCSLAIGIAA